MAEVRRVAALVVAAGSGTRAASGNAPPKQYRGLGGMPVLARTLRVFAAHPRVSGILAVVGSGDRPRFEAAAAGLPKLLGTAEGGETRQASVRSGLEALAADPPDLVLIHDGVRPFVRPGLLDRVLEALERTPAAAPAVPVTDTLKRCRDGRVEATVARQDLFAVQTPQGFRFAAVLAAHRAAAGRNDLTDDLAVAELAGLDVAIVPGDKDNVKLTTLEDFAEAEARLSAGLETRVGQGFDVHAFGEGDGVMLCGLRVPFGRGLVGHSDADVGLHALTDALLASIGEGDIGQHFPPSDPQWRGAASELFLRFAGDRVRARGGRITALDVTLVCEEPKIAPHREAMRARIGEIARVSPARVSVKATTSERLGFTGRREGIAALALATVRLPAETGDESV